MSDGNADKIQYDGVHHLALVSKDMARTVDFYTNVMDMKLVKGFDLGFDMGQHFFFDMGGIMLEFCADVSAGTDDIAMPVNAEGLKAEETVPA